MSFGLYSNGKSPLLCDTNTTGTYLLWCYQQVWVHTWETPSRRLRAGRRAPRRSRRFSTTAGGTRWLRPRWPTAVLGESFGGSPRRPLRGLGAHPTRPRLDHLLVAGETCGGRTIVVGNEWDESDFPLVVIFLLLFSPEPGNRRGVRARRHLVLKENLLFYRCARTRFGLADDERPSGRRDGLDANVREKRLHPSS